MKLTDEEPFGGLRSSLGHDRGNLKRFGFGDGQGSFAVALYLNRRLFSQAIHDLNAVRVSSNPGYRDNTIRCCLRSDL
jgi:hypothetical protein